MNDSLPSTPSPTADDERARRWRLVLGQEEEQPGGPGESGEGRAGDQPLGEQDQALDRTLEALYGESEGGDLSDSAPDIARWLGDIRRYFPEQVVRIMQRDALQKIKLRKVLDEPELLAGIEPDVHLVADILALQKVMPAQTQQTAKEVVRQVVDSLREKLTYPLEQAVRGSLDRAARTRRPRYKEINWNRTIYKNLRHYQPQQRTVVPETLVGYGRRRSALRDIIVAVDTSGSMASSVVYGSIYASVLAGIPALNTSLVLFDTAVVDLSADLSDPVEMLFGIRLGGGTNIERALAYCRGLISRPQDTVLVLISDLYEGGDKDALRQRAAALLADGVQVVVLLALSDQGTPRFERELARDLAELGAPAFACTPDLFPELMAAVLEKRDLRQWTAVRGVVTAPDN